MAPEASARHPRYRVNIQVDRSTREFFIGGRVTNISRGGLFIETESPLPIHSDIDLTLKLPEIRTTLALRGRVVWTYDMRRGTAHLMTGSGIKFMDISPQQRRLLEAYLDRILHEQMAS